MRRASLAPKAPRALSIPGPPGRAITSLSPSQPLKLDAQPAAYAATPAGERKLSPRPAIRAILLASAMMTTLGGRRCKIQRSPAAARALAKCHVAGTNVEQKPDVAVTAFGDPAKLVLAAARVTM